MRPEHGPRAAAATSVDMGDCAALSPSTIFDHFGFGICYPTTTLKSTNIPESGILMVSRLDALRFLKVGDSHFLKFIE